jgi:hypothetical protein
MLTVHPLSSVCNAGVVAPLCSHPFLNVVLFSVLISSSNLIGGRGMRWVRHVAYVGGENRFIQAFVEDRGRKGTTWKTEVV